MILENLCYLFVPFALLIIFKLQIRHLPANYYVDLLNNAICYLTQWLFTILTVLILSFNRIVVESWFFKWNCLQFPFLHLENLFVVVIVVFSFLLLVWSVVVLTLSVEWSKSYLIKSVRTIVDLLIQMQLKYHAISWLSNQPEQLVLFKWSSIHVFYQVGTGSRSHYLYEDPQWAHHSNTSLCFTNLFLSWYISGWVGQVYTERCWEWDARSDATQGSI